MKPVCVFSFLFILSCSGYSYGQKLSEKPQLTKLPFAFSQTSRTPVENSPVIFDARLLLIFNYRPGGAEAGEGINNSDVDILEYQGKTYLYYAIGDQETWGTIEWRCMMEVKRNFLNAVFRKISDSL